MKIIAEIFGGVKDTLYLCTVKREGSRKARIDDWELRIENEAEREAEFEIWHSRFEISRLLSDDRALFNKLTLTQTQPINLTPTNNNQSFINL